MWLIISDTHVGDRQANRNLPGLLSLLEDFSKEDCTLVLNGDTQDRLQIRLNDNFSFLDEQHFIVHGFFR